MSFWIYVAMMLTLPRLLYRLLYEGKPYSELPGNYHYTCRFLDSLMLLGFFALQVLSEFQAKWRASIFWIIAYLLLAWLVHTYTTQRAINTALKSIKIAFPETTAERFDPNSFLGFDGKGTGGKVL